MSKTCQDPDSVYNVVSRKCVQKSSPAGKILANPQNKRCKDDKVINPKTNRCVDPSGSTMRPMLMDGSKKEKKPVPRRKTAADDNIIDSMLVRNNLDFTGLRYLNDKNNDLHHASHKRLLNAIMALQRLHTKWVKGQLKTDAQIVSAQKEFEKVQRYFASMNKIDNTVSREFLIALTHIQRLEYESPDVASARDFEVVMEKLLAELQDVGQRSIAAAASPVAAKRRPVASRELPADRQYVDDKRAIGHDASQKRLANAVMAVQRLHTKWAKGQLKTDVQISRAQKDFEKLQRYSVYVKPDKKVTQGFFKALTNIQRLEYESPLVASAHDFEVVLQKLSTELRDAQTKMKSVSPVASKKKTPSPCAPAYQAKIDSKKKMPQERDAFENSFAFLDAHFNVKRWADAADEELQSLPGKRIDMMT